MHPWIACSQLGYERVGVKKAVICGPRWMSLHFALIDEDMKKVLIKPLQRVEISFDAPSALYWIADFSEWQKTGRYAVQVGNTISFFFTIEDNVYQKVMSKAYGYFSYQRCGVEVKGVHGPCHLDDGWRTDTKQHWDAVGGWHDAGDVRKWIPGTVLAMYGLLNLYETLRDLGNLKQSSNVLDEAIWGNKFLLKMQDPETGNVFISVYRSTLRFGPGNEGNVLTDNSVGTTDDRPILVIKDPTYPDTHGVPMGAQCALGFVAVEALMGRVMAKRDPVYSKKCLKAARKALEWLDKSEQSEEIISYAWRVLAGLEMYEATDESGFLEQAVGRADSMVELQEKNRYGNYNGFFWNDPKKERIYWQIVNAGDPLIALSKICLHLKSESGYARWLESVKLHATFLEKVSELSPFNIIPCVFAKEPLTEDKYRRIGNLYYRFFYPRFLVGWWWVGINSVLLSNAVGLAYAYQATGKEELKTLANRQIEWIFGCNPFRVCMMVGEGTNTTTAFSANYLFKGWDGIIPGGIVNGIGGTQNDEPCFYPTYFYPTQEKPDWETKEYWTPHNAYFVWFISQIMKSAS